MSSHEAGATAMFHVLLVSPWIWCVTAVMVLQNVMFEVTASADQPLLYFKNQRRCGVHALKYFLRVCLALRFENCGTVDAG